MQTIFKKFKEISGFPWAVGAIDGCHSRIRARLKDAEDYINRKGYHSIVLQRLVDNNYMFCNVFMGWPGKSHDAKISKKSPIFLPTTLSRHTRNTSIPPLILGDSVYALEELIMRSYADRGDLNPQEKRYNVALSKSLVVVENAFGRFKGRFQCLSKRLDISVQNTVNIVAACCLLHNVCELKKHEFFEDLLQNIDKDFGENIPYPGICRGFGPGEAIP